MNTAMTRTNQPNPLRSRSGCTRPAAALPMKAPTMAPAVTSSVTCQLIGTDEA